MLGLYGNNSLRHLITHVASPQIPGFLPTPALKHKKKKKKQMRKDQLDSIASSSNKVDKDWYCNLRISNSLEQKAMGHKVHTESILGFLHVICLVGWYGQLHSCLGPHFTDSPLGINAMTSVLIYSSIHILVMKQVAHMLFILHFVQHVDVVEKIGGCIPGSILPPV